MFEVETIVRCDNCGLGQPSYGESIKDCLSRRALEKMLENVGWIKIHKKVQHLRILRKTVWQGQHAEKVWR